mgnify:CR=1 FL=1
MPCITFILPIYNMERLLPRALRSLRAQTLLKNLVDAHIVLL